MERKGRKERRIKQKKKGRKDQKIRFSWHFLSFPGGSDSKQSSYNVGDSGPISGLGRSPGEGDGKSVVFSSSKNINSTNYSLLIASCDL